jgi:hypothetical protein
LENIVFKNNSFSLIRMVVGSLIVLCLGLLTGCGQLAPIIHSSTNPNKFDFGDEYNKYLVAKYTGGNLQKLIDNNSKDKESKESIRNEIVNDFLSMADTDYAYFKNGLLAGRAESDAVLDISDLILSTTGTLFGSVTGKANLSAASTILKGSRSAYDKNFFAQQTIASIINVIEEARKKDRIEIKERLKTGIDEYPLSTAVAEADKYKRRANILAGALDVTNKTAEKR